MVVLWRRKGYACAAKQESSLAEQIEAETALSSAPRVDGEKANDLVFWEWSKCSCSDLPAAPYLRSLLIPGGASLTHIKEQMGHSSNLRRTCSLATSTDLDATTKSCTAGKTPTPEEK